MTPSLLVINRTVTVFTAVKLVFTYKCVSMQDAVITPSCFRSDVTGKLHSNLGSEA